MSYAGKKTDENGNIIRELSENMKEAKSRSFESIKKKALLVTLERSVFSNFIFDPKFNTEICDKFKISDPTVVHVRKCLIHPSHLEDLMNITNDSIMLLWNLTRPWDNNDFRMLPMEMYDDFNQTFQKLKDDFEEKLEVFKDNYPDYIKEAKTTLGSAFNKADYPTVKELDDIFQLKVVTREISDPDDIRLNLTEQELCDMEHEIASNFEDTQTALRGHILDVMDKTTSYLRDHAKDPKLVNLLAPMGALVTMLNSDDDPAVEQSLMEFKDVLTDKGFDADEMILTSVEKEAKRYETMSEDEMMMASDDMDPDDEVGDDLDADW